MLIARKPLSDEVLNHSVDLSAGLIMSTEDEMDAALCGKPVVSQPAQSNTVQNSAPQTESAPSQSTQTADLASQAIASQSTSTQNTPTQQATSFDNMAPAHTTQQAESTTSDAHVCPFGHKWGDANNQPEPVECATCQAWVDCIDAFNA